MKQVLVRKMCIFEIDGAKNWHRDVKNAHFRDLKRVVHDFVSQNFCDFGKKTQFLELNLAFFKKP